ncbi:MAG: ATP-grasp domain-containing protein [Lachnospiraceae bacterium]|nr:ATP-grasp domain-containing protein [Lachnospiraceae bacterium]
MNIAVIGADAESVHAIRIMHRLGHRVIVVDQNKNAAGAKEADLHISIDISHEDEVISALKKENIDYVFTTPIGRHLNTIGAVNDALGLPGIGRDTAVLCTDKYAFHNRLRNVKLRSGHCYLVNSSTPVNPGQISYPAVFKPRYGSHGRSVHYLENADEFATLLDDIWGMHEEYDYSIDSNVSAQEFARDVKQAMEQHQKKASLEDDPNDDYIIEDAIVGTEYAVDGVVEGCNFEMMLIRRKELTPPPYRQALSYMVMMPGEDARIEKVIREYMGRICEVLGFKDCFLHTDVCILGHQINAIEMSASPAGRHVYDELIPMATGIDPTEQLLRYIAGEAHCFQPLNMKRMLLQYFDAEHCFVHGIPEKDEVAALLPEGVRLRSWECKMKLLDYLGSINDEKSLLDRGYFIIEGKNERLLDEAVDIIRNSFDFK